MHRIEHNCEVDNVRVLASGVNWLVRTRDGKTTYPIVYPQAKAIEETNA